MKIVFLVSHLKSGGAERTVSYLSEYMARNGCETTVLSISSELFYNLSNEVKLLSLGIESRSKNLLHRIIKAIERKVKVASQIYKINPDVVFCMLPDTAKYILDLHRIGKFKLITSERANHNFVTDKKTAKLREYIFDSSDGIVFQTERALEWFSKEIGNKGTVIHNAVGNELVYEVPEVRERKKKISAVGRLSQQKDYPTLLKAFSLILKKYPEYTLEIFGDGEDRNKLELLAQELDVASNVKFMGVHKDAILQIADSSCYVMSSIFEGMPNALMEAMAVGLPCVSTDCPNGPAELIVNGENGLLVPVGDYVSLADAILRMIEDKEFSENCGKNAKKILETHSVEIIAKKYMDYIESVVRKGKQ